MRLLGVMSMMVILGSGIAATPRLLAQRPDLATPLLEAATQAELVDGNLDAAIKVYQRVLASFTTDRAAMAAALLGLGRCYEQLGQPKAREIYERLISQYSDRTKEAAAARTRLAKLVEDARDKGQDAQTVIRQVFEAPLPSVNGGNGANGVAIFSDLAVHDPNTGETRRLVTGARSAAYPVVSPTGNRRQVAYVSWSGDLQANLKQAQDGRAGHPARIELRVVGIDGSGDRALLSSRELRWLRPHAWSPDGDQIAVHLERRDGRHDIVLVTVADGRTDVVKTLPASPQEVGFSLDGRLMAYNLPSPRDARRLEMFVVPLQLTPRGAASEHRYSLAFGSEAAPVDVAQQQALHVLNRLTFGPRAGDVEKVAAIGVDRYIERQLQPEQIPDPDVDAKLAGFRALKMDLREIIETAGPVAPQAIRGRASIFEKRAIADRAQHGNRRVGEDNTVMPTTFEARRAFLAGRPEPDEIQRARVIRAMSSERQLFELMVDFWMNHFSIRHNDQQQTPHFEEQVIRRHALGKFEDLLMAVAKHPRMLNYLDNWRSSAPGEVVQQRLAALRPGLSDEQYLALRARTPFLQQAKGLNENYARELMELHTLGIDGGYTQADVIEVAKVLTGWTISTDGIAHALDDDGVFVFDPLLHVDGDKTVLGTTIPSGGIEEGEQVLRLLARHPSTARFIATKLARRFVADDPPADVVAAASRTFQQSGGDLRQVLRTIFKSPQFRASDAYRAKIKKPFELIVSSLRALNAEVTDDVPFFSRVALSANQNNPSYLVQMGERLYTYEAPDGNPDVSAAWMNSNALLVRLEFANALVSGRIPGVTVNLAAAQRLLEQMGIPRPTREQIENTRALLQAAAAKPNTGMRSSESMMMAGGAAAATAPGPSIDPAAIVVAAMLGSPQFQKR